MARERYAAQVRLLFRLLPIVAQEEVFALKGGTAINLFYRDLPRLSVDIDLTYLPIADRETSLRAIDEALDRIAAAAGTLRGVKAARIGGGGGGDTRVQVEFQGARVKIETTPVTRGVVFDPDIRAVTDTVQDEFGFAETRVVSFEDLYAGKIVAALDRQHPRDLFDVKLLYDNEGLTDEMFRVLLVYLASSSRPPHELLRPHLHDISEPFAREFVGMTNEAIPLDALYEARNRLIADVQHRARETGAEFLMGLHDGAPDFGSIGLAHAAELPAVKWKLQNIGTLKRTNADKHAAQRADLEAILS